MIHELRSYRLLPAHMRDFLALTRDVAMPLRLSHSKLLGYWTLDVGALNEVTSLWEYENFAHRAKVRAALAADAAWNKDFLSPSRPWSLGEESTILLPTPACRVAPMSGHGIYELRNYQIAPGRLQDWLATFTEALAVRRKYSEPVGLWTCEIGGLNQVFHLWPYKDLESRRQIREAAMADPIWRAAVAAMAGMTQWQRTKALVPTAWSPLG